MWILLIPLVVAEFAFWVALLYFAWRTYRAIVSGNRPIAAFWLCLIALPFIFYFYKHVEADAKEAARISHIASLPRATIAKDHPKLLEVHGHATEFELLIFLDAMKFEEVVVFQRPRQGEIYGLFSKLASGCEGLGIEHLETWKKRGRFSAPKQSDKDCLVTNWESVSDERAAIPAVEYRQGTQSTLVLGGNNWANGAFEVRLRTTDSSTLIEYWERPYIARPAWPGPWGYAFPRNTNRKKYSPPKRLDFILDAMVENS